MGLGRGCAAAGGCASQPPVPVEDRSGGAVPGGAKRRGMSAQVRVPMSSCPAIRSTASPSRTVWTRDLARWNGIAPPHHLCRAASAPDGPAALPADAPPGRGPRQRSSAPSARRPLRQRRPATARDPGLAEEIAAEERGGAGDRGAPSTATAAPPRDARTAAQSPGRHERPRPRQQPARRPGRASMAAAGAAARRCWPRSGTAVAPPAPTPAAAPLVPAAAAPSARACGPA